MSDSRFDEEAFRIYNHVLDLKPEARNAYIEQACIGRFELFAEVRDLLKAAQAGSFGFRTALHHEINASLKLSEEADPMMGAEVGGYRILKCLGVGGMARVYLAQQEVPHRGVALKLLKPGMDSEPILKRFHQEREILARLDHPCIAKIYDAGMSEQGHPFFVMEYIEGTHVTTYCDRHRLSVEARIRLLIRICEAVQHAHRKGIIHRDLKPSNILVADGEGEPLPKIIDFGIAKAFGGPGHPALTRSGLEKTGSQPITATRVFIGSLGYMSPEQAKVTDGDVDTRTDVYALGVLLYELLVGVSPFEELHQPSLSWEDLFRLIRERNPAKPSTRIESLETASREIAASRRSDSRRLKKQFRHDLDWITLKALAKEKERRYDSPTDLARDLSRYLNREPVSAGPPSLSYRSGRFVRRNKLLVGFSIALLLLLFGGLAGTLISLAKSRAETAKAQKALSLIQELISSADPLRQGSEARVRDLLDAFSAKLDGTSVEEPEIRATLSFTLGSTYSGLSLYSRAEEHARRAWDLRRQNLGTNHHDTLEARYLLGNVLSNMGRYKEGEVHLRENLVALHRISGPDHKDTLMVQHGLGISLLNQGKFEEAEAILRDTLARRQRVLGSPDSATIDTNQALGILLLHTRRFDEAETVQRRTLDARLQTLPKTDVAALNAMVYLADVLVEQKKFAEAETLLREAWKVGVEVLGEDHQGTLYSMHGLIRVLTPTGKHDEAVELARELVPLGTGRLGEEHPATLIFSFTLADALMGQGNLSEAETVFREALPKSIGVFGEKNPTVVKAQEGLALTLEKQGRLEEAVPLFRKVIAGRRLAFGPDHEMTRKAIRHLNDIYLKLGRPEDALTILNEPASQRVVETAH